MADSVTEAQKKRPAQAFAAWAQRVHRWLMTEETPTNAGSGGSEWLEAATHQQDAPAAAKPAGGWDTDSANLKQILWGEGWHLPIGDHMTSVMVRSFGLNNTMSVLDLSAGLGGAAQQIVKEFGCYVTGFEADAALVAQGETPLKRSTGKHASLAAYDPAAFKAERRYDAVILRELIYKIGNKKDFIAQVAQSLKEKGHASWTDLVLADTPTDAAAIQNWQDKETGSKPLLLKDVEKLWTINGLDVRVSEDRTGPYADAITAGLSNLVRTISSVELAAAAKSLIMQEVDLWARRMAALGGGLRFYRFYANKR